MLEKIEQIEKKYIELGRNSLSDPAVNSGLQPFPRPFKTK